MTSRPQLSTPDFSQVATPKEKETFAVRMMDKHQAVATGEVFGPFASRERAQTWVDDNYPTNGSFYSCFGSVTEMANLTTRERRALMRIKAIESGISL